MEIMDMQQGIYADTPTGRPQRAAALSHRTHRPNYGSSHCE
jgi:hypothetical protein